MSINRVSGLPCNPDRAGPLTPFPGRFRRRNEATPPGPETICRTVARIWCSSIASTCPVRADVRGDVKSHRTAYRGAPRLRLGDGTGGAPVLVRRCQATVMLVARRAVYQAV